MNGLDYAEPRNILEESARISRGSIKPLSELKSDGFDALFLPGGFGVAKNLSNYASAGENMVVEKEVEKALWSFFHAKKPIGACCIAPIILAKIFGTVSGNSGLDITLGKKGEGWPYGDTIDVANKFGNKVIPCDVDEVCKDRYHKIVTTPAYMKGDATPYQVFEGVKKLVQEVIKLNSSL